MKVARRVLQAMWPEDRGVPGLVQWWGDFWVWMEVEGVWKWKRLGEQAMEDRVRLALEDAHVGAQDGVARYRVTNSKVKEVVDALGALARMPMERHKSMPAWLGQGKCPVDRDRTVAFEDVLVDVSAGCRVVGRGREWFDCVVLPGRYGDERMKTPWFDGAVEGWSQGDEKWKSLGKRVLGMLVMAGRHHHRWPLEYGVAGTGKSTWVKIMEWLVGEDGYLSTDPQSVAGGFGLDGMQGVRLVSVKEVVDLDGKQGDGLAGVMKRLMGQDKVTINAKYERPDKNKEVKALVQLVSNTMPRLPNDGQGLSAKMLVLPFTKVFRGEAGENLRLEDELRGELPGIARWALEGAVEIEGAAAKERWPVPAAAEETVKGFVVQNNPAQAFLGARFTQKEDGFVATEMLWKEWLDWKAANGVQMQVGKNEISLFLRTKGAWPLFNHRQSGGGSRGLKGLSLRRVADDSL